ncbi:MAG: putative Glyoxalase [Nitrospira sp.]|jgi:extradiol dioxygenase family protein|nr:putative Glyoxalase [Nitrospira sp.]
MPALFHLAFPVRDLAAAKHFYVQGLGCVLGRESSKAVTFGLAGHQIIAHLTPDMNLSQKGVYPRHFGLVLTLESEWQALADRATDKGLKFYQQPRRRFAGTRIEHLTFFLEDPSQNLLEFKHYLHESAIFGEHDFTAVGDAE